MLMSNFLNMYLIFQSFENISFCANSKKMVGNYYKENTNISINSPSEEIDFQNYVDSVKQKKTTWNIFESLIKDFIYSDIKRLKLINAILLTELTPNNSDIDRLKYLNSILLCEFKQLIQREEENDLANEAENENLDETEILKVCFDVDDKIIKEENEIQSAVEIIEGEDLPILIKERIEPNQIQYREIAKTFQCNFCKKMFSINFHLKQHIRKAHENVSFSKESDSNSLNDSNHEEEINQSNVNYQLLVQGNVSDVGNMYSYDTSTERFSEENNLKSEIIHKKLQRIQM